MMKKLYRSKYDVKIAGVCAGIGEYYDIDPTMVRLLFVLVSVMTVIMPMIFIYLVAWAIIPIED